MRSNITLLVVSALALAACAVDASTDEVVDQTPDEGKSDGGVMTALYLDRSDSSVTVRAQCRERRSSARPLPWSFQLHRNNPSTTVDSHNLCSSVGCVWDRTRYSARFF